MGKVVLLTWRKHGYAGMRRIAAPLLGGGWGWVDLYETSYQGIITLRCISLMPVLPLLLVLLMQLPLRGDPEHSCHLGKSTPSPLRGGEPRCDAYPRNHASAR